MPISNIYLIFTYLINSGHSSGLATGLGFLTLPYIYLSTYIYSEAKNLLTVYRSYSPDPPFKPTDQKLQEMKELTSSIVKAQVGKNASPDNVVIWLNISNMEDLKNEKGQIRNESVKYRAKLSRTLAIIVSSDCKYINFLHPEEFALVDQGRIRILSRRRVEVRIKGSKFARCVTSKLGFQRYQQWKNTMCEQAAATC